jgi:hypothetical protein
MVARVIDGNQEDIFLILARRQEWRLTGALIAMPAEVLKIAGNWQPRNQELIAFWKTVQDLKPTLLEVNPDKQLNLVFKKLPSSSFQFRAEESLKLDLPIEDEALNALKTLRVLDIGGQALRYIRENKLIENEMAGYERTTYE